MSTSRLATSSDVILWYPSLASVSSPLMDAAIEAVECLFNADVWGCNLLMGSVHATAHMLLMQQASASGSSIRGSGPVSQMSMGPVSTSYAITKAATDNGAWGLTPAGQRYLALRDMLGPVPTAPGGIGGCDDAWSSLYSGGCGCR